MSLSRIGIVNLPEHKRDGGFDHAAVHRASGQLYVAHTANDALDLIDCVRDMYVGSIPHLKGVAGALVSDERNLVFTSNRGENTVGIFDPARPADIQKVPVGVRPNGLAFDPLQNLLLAANVGDAAIEDSHTVTLVDAGTRTRIGDVRVPGRTRWTVFDPQQQAFFVNIAVPPQIVVMDALRPLKIANQFDISVAGPHGLDLDLENRRLFCACDGKALVVLDSHSGEVAHQVPLSGVPDVIFYNAALKRLYVAIGDPGVIDVIDTQKMRLAESVATERGAHTIALDAMRNKVYAFLPQSHRAAVFLDHG